MTNDGGEISGEMAMTRVFATVLATMIVAATGFVSGADAADYGVYSEKKFRLWPDQQCDDKSIISAVTRRFNWAQKKTFKRDIRIDAMLDPHEYSYRVRDPAFQNRRFCRATASLSDGRQRAVYYMISYDGWPPMSSGLEFCVTGYDYFRAYAPGCGQLRPR